MEKTNQFVNDKTNTTFRNINTMYKTVYSYFPVSMGERAVALEA
jgi:hypothetical protein